MASQHELDVTTFAVTTLNTKMMQRGITADYELVYDGAKTDGEFVYDLHCGEHVVTGRGSSKKFAKQNAAMAMLYLIKENDERSSVKTPENIKPEAWWAAMPINALQVTIN